MKKLLFTLLAAASLSACAARESLTDLVDPRIGTAHSRWFFFTPAAVPFGMAKPAPTTDGHLGNPGGWQAVGYDARHTSIEGFANFHEFQVGGVVVAPTVGALQTVPGALDDPESGYRSRFDKADETARPGYYAVLLKDYGVRAELTATARVAFHRYTFPATDEANLVFNIGARMGESGPVRDARVTLTDEGRIEGWVTTEPVYVDIYQKGASVTMYFSAEPDAEPSAFGTFRGDETFAGERTREGVGAGLYLRFDTRKQREVGLKIGLSYTSVENARANLAAEAAGMDFDAARGAAERVWEENLGRIRVEGGRREDRVKFYTGLFHALLGRGLASDVNGAYPRNDGSVGRIALGEDGKPLHNHYNTDAIWGGFWNLTQLWSLAWPEYYADWISSQLLVYKDAGWLGDGIACSKYVSGVGTNFTGLAIAAAYNVGIRNFDTELGFEAALKNEIGSENRPAGAGKLDVGQFVARGYSPYIAYPGMQTTPDGSDFSASHTLEYCFSSYAVAQMARQMGRTADYEKLTKLSEGWQLLFDPETRLMRPRDEKGAFIADFDPYAPWVGFQEGNAIQYTYYVPHHIERLVETVGREEFNNRLDSIFLISREHIFGGGRHIDAFAGLRSYYNHGNQPNLHISALFNFSGKPWLSQKWMRTICNEFYGTEGIHGYGYGQDEDQGQLGAWYVLASIGLFDAKGLTAPDPAFQVGSPLFDRITIRLNPDYYAGSKFVIETEDNTPGNCYIRSMELDGKPLRSVQLPFREVVRGGRLRLRLGAEPATELTR
ncbi:GH92 family glycosyl hydrolase [Alistipes sp.]|uniref:GH92 family glycosyl hydrolase n=1 Tax=Alistipes sp. TaxID=1872444 RepID=UPI003AF17DD8